jgi:hypothetical protein
MWCDPPLAPLLPFVHLNERMSHLSTIESEAEYVEALFESISLRK